MRIPALTRRSALRLGALGVGGLLLAPAALAGPVMRWPLRLAYLRVSPSGFVHIRSEEQQAWTHLQTRLGGLIETIQPLQPDDMLGGRAPQVEGGANCALVGRQMAAAAGFDQLILYATHDGQRAYKSDGSWFSDIFASLQADLDKDDRAMGEVHLLDVMGGPALVTISADAKPRDPLNLFDSGRNPERETLAGLIQGLERRLQDLARDAYENQRSIGDF